MKISIRNLIYKNPFLAPVDIVDMLDLPCSPETVRNYLLELGLSYRNISKKEPLDQAKKKNDRLELCYELKDF